MLRVIALRPTTFAVVIIITAGCLAALPFRREDEQRLDPPGSRSPGGGENDSLTASSSAWPQYPGFDPSLAWQPVPMTLPERPIAAQPPMPDSYYDVAFELERPEPVRERFGAVADPADRFTREPVRTVRPAAQRSVEAAADTAPSAGEAATSRDQDFRVWAAQRPADTPSPPSADDLIADRFEFTPLEPIASRRRWPTDPPPTSRSAIRNASTGPTPRDASEASPDRPRYFIREPD